MNKLCRLFNESFEYCYQFLYSLFSLTPSFSEVNPLIVILSCQQNDHLWDELLARDKNVIIFCGYEKL